AIRCIATLSDGHQLAGIWPRRVRRSALESRATSFPKGLKKSGAQHCASRRPPKAVVRLCTANVRLRRDADITRVVSVTRKFVWSDRLFAQKVTRNAAVRRDSGLRMHRHRSDDANDDVNGLTSDRFHHSVRGLQQCN